MKRKATAQPVDHLAFLQREKKRPIVPRNPHMPVTPEVILPIDPFVTPEFPLFQGLDIGCNYAAYIMCKQIMSLYKIFVIYFDTDLIDTFNFCQVHASLYQWKQNRERFL